MPPLIIEAAINGATRKDSNAYVPRSVKETVASACASLDAGAATVHHHKAASGMKSAPENGRRLFNPVYTLAHLDQVQTSEVAHTQVG